jgi:ubiquitin carboxyl-terminal hydrolase 25/28
MTEKKIKTENKIKELEEQIKGLVTKFDDHTNPYHLHAITIHDGTQDQGHYFQLIRDHSKDIWRRFNDDHISELSTEDVYLFANGGHSMMTASWVIYIHESER